jgi:GNAT superfamily N-acetyltransferase
VLELYALYVDPPFVGTGFGRALQEDFLARARRAGCEEVVLWVLPENRLARRFYASAGYRDDERAQERPLGDTGVYTRRMRRSL